MTHDRSLRADTLSIYGAALRAAEPGRLVRRALVALSARIGVPGASSRRPRPRRIHVLALGKAAAAMARGAVRELGPHVVEGIVARPAADRSPLPPPLEDFPGEHPVPGPGSFDAGRALLRAAARLRQDDLALVLVSGGGSALAAVPAAGLSEQEKAAAHLALLRSGLGITAVNAVRCKLSALKGGRLADACYPALTLTLALLDVPASQPWACASGPTWRPPADAPWRRRNGTGYARLLEPETLRSLGMPAQALRILRHGGERFEEPFMTTAPARPRTFLAVGDRRAAAAGAARQARRLGYRVRVIEGRVRGEAARFGAGLARQAVHLLRRYRSPSCLIATGEPRVAAGAPCGLGGRCQQVALAASLHIERAEGLAILAAGTDGRDGDTAAAGAIVDGHTAERIRKAGADPKAALRERRAGPALSATRALIAARHTGTNVNDLFVVLVRRG